MRTVCLFLCSLFFSSDAALAQDIKWPRIGLTPLVSGLSSPTHVTDAGDGSGRLFIVEQRGTIRIFKDDALLPRSFLDIRDRVLSGGEQGLLSVAFPPGFRESPRFYVYYTARPQGNIVVARFQVTEDPDVADPATETFVLGFDHPTYANHNGGQLVFGPNDGYLYIGTGDGGGGGDPFRHAQNPAVLLGKLLRIDVESGEEGYAIPPDNPYVGVEGARPEIWAIGLRNPWRFSFDQETQALYIADVGQNLYEEVDFQLASSTGGENYGWSIMEGLHCYRPPVGCDQEGLTLPVLEYNHSQGDCSITGGYVYRGKNYPGMQGIYFYGDYCTGRIWGLQFDGNVWQSSLLLDRGLGLSISTFGRDEDGNLLVANYARGEISVVTELR